MARYAISPACTMENTCNFVAIASVDGDFARPMTLLAMIKTSFLLLIFIIHRKYEMLKCDLHVCEARSSFVTHLFVGHFEDLYRPVRQVRKGRKKYSDAKKTINGRQGYHS